MRSSGKTDAVLAWARGYPQLEGYLKLNATDLEGGERSMQTVTNDAEVRQFIDGTRERVLTFALVMVTDWSDGFDRVNAEAQAWGEGWLDWCAAQFEAGNVPDLGEGCTVTDIVPLQNAPALSMTYQENQLAKYMFQIQIQYREKE